MVDVLLFRENTILARYRATEGPGAGTRYASTAVYQVRVCCASVCVALVCVFDCLL